MSLCRRLLLLLLLLAAGSWHSARGWDYGNDNGASWRTLYPQFCAGRKQAPIDLDVGHSEQDSSLSAFAFGKTNPASYQLTTKNNDHTVVMSWSSDYRIQMGLSSSQMFYTAAQLHYHWGSVSSRGSEHTVGGSAYAAEAHLVFYNSNDYANFSEAFNKPGGLAVLGVFLEESATENPLLAALQTYIGGVRTSGSQRTDTVQSSDVDMVDKLLPADRSSFYRYEGSLTTPDCHETVLWTVFTKPTPVSSAQLQMLRSLKHADNSNMQDNYRAVLQLNPSGRPGAKRVLYRSFSGAAGARATFAVVAAAAAAAVAAFAT